MPTVVIEKPRQQFRSLRSRKSLVMVLMIAILVSGCGENGDPRAYPGTQHRSLDSLLHRFMLHLPPCEATGLRYYSRSDMSGDLSITFSVPEDCLVDFLQSIGADNTDMYRTTGNHVAIPRTTIKKLGWPIDSDKSYDVYSVAPTSLTSFRIVVDRSGRQPVVYLDGIRS